MNTGGRMNTRPEPGTLNDATKQINEALYSLTELYNYALQALETTPRSKHGKQIKYLVESTGARLHIAKMNIEAAQKAAETPGR